jgi:hypothetical protein
MQSKAYFASQSQGLRFSRVTSDIPKAEPAPSRCDPTRRQTQAHQWRSQYARNGRRPGVSLESRLRPARARRCSSARGVDRLTRCSSFAGLSKAPTSAPALWRRAGTPSLLRRPCFLCDKRVAHVLEPAVSGRDQHCPNGDNTAASATGSGCPDDCEAASSLASRGRDRPPWRDPLSSVRSVCELGGPRASACQSRVAARAARPAASARSPWRWPRLA